MKKLMTSLLAVLLCIGFCWAQTVTVTGKVQYQLSSSSAPESNAFQNAKVKLEAKGDGASGTHEGEVTASDGTFTIENVPSGLYTATFTGDIQQYTNITYSEDASIGVGRTLTITIPATAFSSTPATPTTETLTVKVAYAPEGFESQTSQPNWISGASVTCKEKNSSDAGVTATTAPDYSKGIHTPQATFTIDPSKDYTISVSAELYKNNSVEWAANTASKTVNIAMTPITVTVQGTVKLGTTTLTELPEGMTLKMRVADITTPITVNANGYKLENIWTGNTYILVEPDKNYSITEPANGNFTIADNDNHTVTQNIVISKTAATVFVKTNADDNINADELLLAQGEKTFTATKKTDDNMIVFEGIAAGTYTVKLNRFGYKIQGTAPTVTVGDDCADQTVETIAIEANPETITISGVAKYYNKADNNAVVNLNGAEVKLYSVTPDHELGEVLETKTTGADGAFSFTQTITKPTYYGVTITHNAILPWKDASVYVRTSEKTVDPTLNVIWISGNITNADDLSGEPTVTAQTTENNGYVKLSEYDWVYFNTEYDSKNAKYYVYSSNAAPLNETYKLECKGKDINGYVMAVTENVTIANGGAATKNLTPVKDENSGYMTIRLRYRSITEDILPVKTTIKVFLNDETSPKRLSTDNNGNATVLVAKNDKCKLEIDDVTRLGYQNKTLEEVNCFFTDGQGTVRPTDTTIYLSGVEAKSVTVSGHVAKKEGLGSAVRLALETQRDHVLMYSDIAADGLYRFENVPVVNSDNMNVFLVEEGGKYNADYNVTVPYNYAVNPQSIPARVGGPTNIEQDLTVYQNACNVSGTVSPATSYEVSLTPAGETRATYSETFNSRNFKFQGVTAGTYTLNVKADGYELYSSELKIDARELKDITLEAITLTSKAETITVTGKIDAYNKATHEYFDGAKLSIWNSEGTEKIVEVTMPEDAYGYIPSDFKFQATMGTEVLFKMEHPSIKPISKTYTVNATTLPISNLPYEFVVEGADWIVMTDFKAEWNTTLDSLKLSWKWPANAADAKIRKIDMKRRLTNEASSANRDLTYWASEGASFAANELPVAYTDTVSQTLNYTYTFDIYYIDAPMHTVAFKADMRDGERYKLAYSVNDDKMGTISSYSQPEGEYMEGDQITLTAKAKEGYKFVEFLKNGEKLSEAEIAKLTLQSDTVAIYGFKMPAEDVTIKAVFASRSGNVDPETKEYTVTLKSSNEAWGTVSGAGKFEEGKEIEVKATVTDEAKYEFVAWKEGDKEVSKDATYKFKVEKDITLTAVFKEKVANENLKAARWAIFAEDGAIVIKGINGDRYDIYDLNGHHCGAALCTGAEIRLNVAKSKLYIVRRLGADGSFDAKKIVVR